MQRFISKFSSLEQKLSVKSVPWDVFSFRRYGGVKENFKLIKHLVVLVPRKYKGIYEGGGGGGGAPIRLDKMPDPLLEEGGVQPGGGGQEGGIPGGAPGGGGANDLGGGGTGPGPPEVVPGGGGQEDHWLAEPLVPGGPGGPEPGGGGGTPYPGGGIPYPFPPH